MKDNKIKDTLKICKWYGTPETKEERQYTEEEVNKIPGKINDSIQEYIMNYKKEPQLILISTELEIFLINKIDIMHHRQLIMLGNKELRVDFMFGIPILTTPVLDGLEFEIR